MLRIFGACQRRIVYRDPATGERFVFLTTAMNLQPGLIALLYLRRWKIEKAYDVYKNKLYQQKAWDGVIAVQTPEWSTTAGRPHYSPPTRQPHVIFPLLATTRSPGPPCIIAAPFVPQRSW